MSYMRKVFGLGILLLIVLSILVVPMAMAQEGTATPAVEQPGAQTTPAVDEPSAATTPAVDEPSAATTPAVEDPNAAATTVVEPGAAQQQAPGTLPQTGAVTTPSTSIMLLAIGGLILVGGLGLALTRRRS